MALYTIKSRDEAMRPLMGYSGNNRFVLNQIAQMNGGATPQSTQIISALGRTTGAEGNGGSNFFEKRGRSIENAVGTSLVAPIEAIRSGGGIFKGTENIATDNLLKDTKKSMNDIAKKYGYNSWSDWQDAYQEAKDASDTAKVAEMKTQLKEFQAQANTNAAKADKKAADFNDYRENNYISKKVNQDNTKFLGSAINTLSTGADVTGISSTPLSNAVQGGLEGLADEMEQNGGNIDLTRPFSQGIKITGGDNFSWQRAGQNALIGATTGAATGALNTGISNSLAKRAAAKGLTNTATKAGIGNAIKSGAKTIATGAARGALSGAVGGATGAGLQSAMNGVEFGQGVQNALQGAGQGAIQGAWTGGIMAGANAAFGKTNFGRQLQNAKANWDQSGRNFDERLTNTLTSGDSAVGDWLMNKRQSRVLGTAGNLGNRVQFVDDEFELESIPGMSKNLQKYLKNTPRTLKNMAEEVDHAKYLVDQYDKSSDKSKTLLGGIELEGPDGAKMVEAMRELAANGDTIMAEIGGSTQQTPTTANKYVGVDTLGNRTEYTPDEFARLLQEYDNTTSPQELSGNSSSEVSEVVGRAGDELLKIYKTMNGGVEANPYNRESWEQFDNWLANQRANLRTQTPATANNNLGNRVQDVNTQIMSELEQNPNFQKLDTADKAMLKTSIMDGVGTLNKATLDNARNMTAEQLSDNLESMKRWVYSGSLSDDQNANMAKYYDEYKTTPTTAKGWLKKAGQRIVEDINNSNLGNRVKDVSSETPQYDAWDRVAQEAGYNNYDEVIQRYMEANPNTPLNQRGAAGQILTWLDQNPNTPTTAGEWVKRAGQRAVEDINNSNLGMRVRDVSQDMPDDIRNMNIRDYNMYADGESAASEPQTYREALNRGVDNGLSGPELGDIAAPYSNLPNRVNGQELYNLMQNNPQLGSAVSYVASQIADSGETPTYNNMAQNYWDEVRAQYAQAQNYEGPGDYFDGTDEFTMARPTAETIQQTPMQKPTAIQNPQTEVFDSLTGKKTSAASKLRNAAGLKLQAQYGTIDKPTAKATNAPETLQKIANAGFTKPGDVERMADVITGSNGEVSKLVANLVETAKPINTFDGETDGQTMNDFIDLAIQKRGLDGIREGKAVKSQLDALMKSLPSHAEGSISFEDRPTDVFKLTQILDAEAANYEGRSGMNYGTTTPDKLRAAQVIKDVSNLYKNRLYDTVDVKQALTPEVAQNLKAYAPNNKAWANYVDNEIMSASSVKDLRSLQSPWVRAKKIIDNGYMNSVTYGGRNSGMTGNIPLTKRGVVGAMLGATVNSKPGLRAQAKALNKAADIVGGTQPNANATVATPAELADMVSNYDQSTQLYNAIGRTEGAINRDEAARNIANIAQEAEIVPSMSYSPANINNIATNMGGGSTSVYNALTGTPTANQMSYTPNTGYYQPTGDYWTDVIAGALTSAINDNDVEAFKTLYGMYQESLSNLNQNSNASSTSSLNATQQAQLAKLDAADSAIDELETLFENAGGGKGPIAGNLQSIAGNIGWDSGAKTYNDLSEGLVNQISAAIGKTDSLNTEGEVKRALKLIPQLTDDAQTAKNKLEELRRMLATTKSSYNAAYGLGY